MPSWNVHIAHVERLLREEGADALGVRDANAFLFGNLVPDIYVGYLVRPISKKIAYRDTHFANPSVVPYPRFWEFWERYALPSADDDGHVSDVVLGAWAHLVADHVYNRATNSFLARIGLTPSDETRERKQADFASFGRSLVIAAKPRVTPALLAQAAAFPQYAVEEADARAAVRVARQMVDENIAANERLAATMRDGAAVAAGTDGPQPCPHAPLGHEPYTLLDDEFFSTTFEQAHRVIRAGLGEYARNGAAAARVISESDVVS